MLYYFPYACRLCKTFLDLEKDDFNYGLDERDGTTFLLCFPCKDDLEKVAKGKMTKEKFSRLINKRWKEGKLKEEQKIEETRRQGWEVEVVTFGGKSPETISCDQLVKWFNKLEEKKKILQYPNFLIILNNLEKKGKLCYNCSKFRGNLQKEISSNG